MSLTLYVQMKRERPLSEAERELIRAKEEEYNNKPEIQKLVAEGGGETFSFWFDDLEPNVRLESAVKMPVRLADERVDDLMYVGEAWLALVSDVRRSVEGGEWTVKLDDEEVPWIAADEQYELTM